MREGLDRAILAAPEEEELELGTHVHEIAELLGPLHLATEDEARVTGEGLAPRRVDVADDAGRAAGPGALLPRDLGERPHVRHQVLIALGDAREALDRGPIEPGPVANRALELVDRDGDGLDDAHDVGELELNEANPHRLRALDLLDSRHRFVWSDHRFRLLLSRALCGSHDPRKPISSGSPIDAGWESQRRSNLFLLHESDGDREREAQLRV